MFFSLKLALVVLTLRTVSLMLLQMDGPAVA